MLLNRKYPRSSGVLLPMTSLHGPFGIGVLGAEAYEFIDFLSSAGFHAWQILPVEHTGMCNSPYRCISAYAGEPMLIDPRMLLEMELISEHELWERMHELSPALVQYELVRDKQWTLLRAAFSRNTDEAYKSFNPFWLDDYTLYISIKQHFDQEAWFSWPDKGLRSFDKNTLEDYRQKLSHEIDFHKFVQWLFDKQWNKLRSYAAKKGVSIIGDMPIYVSDDSADVWSRRDLFDADINGNFAAIGGCPPDFFSPDGQRWGNPIYNWDKLKKENYKWWINRIKASLERYDVLRLDHFQGFKKYWRIPGEALTARSGKWGEGPGMQLFDALKKELGDLSLSIIAEDLGLIEPEVQEFFKDSGFRGMRVMQFGFMGDEYHLPHNYSEKSAAYTGTHDNTTLISWFFDLSQHDREKALFYTGFMSDWTIGGPGSPIIKTWMRLLFSTSSSLAIVPIQDLLGYGADTRINTPGTPDGNWRFRIREGVLGEIDANYYMELHKTFQREDFLKSFKPKHTETQSDETCSPQDELAVTEPDTSYDLQLSINGI